nr:PREDICTED: protein NLRC3-like isoform X1 [Latimeria chalumnae]|eukprot:XP_006006168.1 PREDICTED: protein NLRC3-like isoform X1 [Latimeria chalumnae]
MDLGPDELRLLEMRPELVERMSERIYEILDHLLSKRTITKEDFSTITGENLGIRDRMRNLLDVLPKRGNDACRDLLELVENQWNSQNPAKVRLQYQFLNVSHCHWNLKPSSFGVGETGSERCGILPQSSTSCQNKRGTDAPGPDVGSDQINFNKLLEKHKEILEGQHRKINDYIKTTSEHVDLKERYTNLTITKSTLYTEQKEHEVTGVGNAFKRLEQETREAVCESDEFCRSFLQQEKGVTLISGVAGGGKTTITKKLIQQWAATLQSYPASNKLVLFFTFRELSLITETRSLSELLTSHYSHLKPILRQVVNVEQSKILLILDGLDEFKFPLDFGKTPKCTDPESRQQIHELIVNIIKGNLLPDSSVLLTSRPHAIGKLPEKCIQNFYQILGFSVSQQKEYFQKTCPSKESADRICGYVSSHKPLSLMCHVPAFCWITSTALQEKTEGLLTSKENMATVTHIYCRFLKAIMIFHGEKMGESSVQRLVNASGSLRDFRHCLKDLGAVAFKGLMEHKFLFHVEDLSRFNVDQGSLSSLFLVEILKEDKDSFTFQKNYHFVHTSLQEFFAAVYYVMESYSGRSPFWCVKPPHNFLLHLCASKIHRLLGRRRLVQKHVRRIFQIAHRSHSGQLDLFCRFVSGLLVPRTSRILEGVFIPRHSLLDVRYLIKLLEVQLCCENICPERLINVCHCLYEAQDQGLRDRLGCFVEDSVRGFKNLSSTDWTRLAFVLQLTNSIEMLNLDKCNLEPEGLRRLLPVLPYFFTLRLAQNPLGPEGAAILAEVLKSQDCRIEKLWIVGTQLGSDGASWLSDGLQQNCTVSDLRMACNNIGDEGASCLAEMLKRNRTLRDIR